MAVPLPLDALVHEAKADDATAQALLAKHNPVLEAAMTVNRAQAKVQGTAEAMLAVLLGRGFEPTADPSSASSSKSVDGFWPRGIEPCSSSGSLWFALVRSGWRVCVAELFALECER